MMKSQKALRDKWMNRCAWCGKLVPEDAPCFGISAKIRPEVDLGGEGPLVEMTLELTDKKTYAIRTTADSPAKQEGWDLVFFLCSAECAHKLHNALEQEVGLLGRSLGRLD
jgi:hypothetical protein